MIFISIFITIFIVSLSITTESNGVNSSKFSVENNICINKECILDSKRLIEASNLDVSPCFNFREYAMGKFIKYRPLHDRYDRVGFLYDVVSQKSSRTRKVLTEQIYANDSVIIKIQKRFFQQCIDPRKLRILFEPSIYQLKIYRKLFIYFLIKI